MSDKVDMAVRSLKTVNTEIVQWENRLQFVQDEVKRLTQTRDGMQAEIDKKSTDYNVYMAQRDTESKKIRQDATDAQMQLAKDKEEFQKILKDFQKERQECIGQKQALDAQSLQVKTKLENIQHFIMAVQRAISVLGL